MMFLTLFATIGSFYLTEPNRLDWRDWINETPSHPGATGIWSPATPATTPENLVFEDEGLVSFAAQETAPEDSITRVILRLCFAHPAVDDAEDPEAQAGIRLVTTNGENRLSVLAAGGWTNLVVAGSNFDYDASYDFAITLARTTTPQHVTYALSDAGNWRTLFEGAARRCTGPVKGFSCDGAGDVGYVRTASNIPIPDGIVAHAGGSIYTTVSEAVTNAARPVTVLRDATYTPMGGEGAINVHAGTLQLSRPTPTLTPERITEGLTLDLDATQGITAFTNANNEICITRWDSQAGNGWSAVPGNSYHGWVRAPRLLLQDCNGHPAVRLAHGTLDKGDEYMLMQHNGTTTRFNNVRTVFWVIGSQDGGGYLLGGGAPSGYAFHRGGAEGYVCSLSTNALVAGATCAQVLRANWRKNGTEINPWSTGLSGYYDCLSMALAQKDNANPPNFDGLAFDGRFLESKQKYADVHGRVGYQRLCQVMVYDRILSQDERQRVEAYLQQKWNLTDDAWRTPVSCDLTSGATLDIADDTARRISLLSGAGTVTGNLTVESFIAQPGNDVPTVTGTLTLTTNTVIKVQNVEGLPSPTVLPLCKAREIANFNPSNVTFTGLPTGWKAQLLHRDGELAVAVSAREGMLFTFGSRKINYCAARVSDEAVNAALASQPYGYTAEPIPERPERAAAAETAVLVYAADNLTSSYPIQPHGTNVPGIAGAPLAWRECPGEKTRGTLLLWSKTAHPNVTLTFSDLTGSAGTIAAANLSAKIVKAWYQANGAPEDHTSYSYEQVLVPELMLNDDDLVIADHANRRNLVRFKRESVRWYADINTMAYNSWAEQIPIERLPIYDADTLQPFTIAARVAKQLMVRLCVPENAQPGDYTGQVTFHNTDGIVATLPLHLTVLPFKLPLNPETTYDSTREYTMGLYLWNSFNNTDTDYIAVYGRSRRQLRNEYASLLDNGITSPTFIWYQSDVYDDDKFRRNLTEVRQAGFAGKRLTLGSSDLIGSDFSATAITTLTNKLVRALATAKDFGYEEVYFYGQDEIVNPSVLSNEVEVWRAAHQVGAKIIVSTIEANRPHFQGQLDMAVHSQPYASITNVDVTGWHADGTRLLKYGSPQTYQENPNLFRRNFGIGIWSRGFDGANTYCDVGGSWVWNDIGTIKLHAETDRKKGNTERGLTLFYPVPDGVIETLALTGLESAIKDVRYFSFLRQRLREHPNADAQAWLDALDVDKADLATARQRAIDWILATY